MRCARGHDNADGARFCIACGTPLAEQSASIGDAVVAPAAPAADGATGRTRRSRPALIAAGAVAVVVAILAVVGVAVTQGGDPAASSDPSSTGEAADAADDDGASASPSATKAPYIDLLADPAKVVVPGQCEDLEAVVTRWGKTAKDALSSSKKATKDAWAAASYESKHDWVGTEPDAEFAAEVDAITTPALDTLTGGQGALVRDPAAYVVDVMRECQIFPAYDTTRTAVADMAERGSAIVAEAATKPWYPKGYNEYVGDANVAWKWLEPNSFDCDYYSATCWGMSIITDDGCPTSLYAEIDIKNSNDVKISYSNDVVNGAGPREKVKLVFNDFTDGARTGYLNQISCY